MTVFQMEMERIQMGKPRPVEASDFVREIKRDLIAEGFSGAQLQKELSERSKQMNDALQQMYKDALIDAKNTSLDELFGE